MAVREISGINCTNQNMCMMEVDKRLSLRMDFPFTGSAVIVDNS